MNIFSGNIKESNEHFSFDEQNINKNNFTFIWSIGSHEHMPYSHIHLFQKETFKVLKGVLSIKFNNTSLILKIGESFTIPKRTWHTPYNDNNDDVVCKVNTFSYIKCSNYN